MEQFFLTKTNTKMNATTRSKIIEEMTRPENDGLNKKQIATKCGISLSTLNNYLTSQTWDDIRKLRLAVVMEALAKVDQAIFAKAIKGDISAAKLIYSRWDSEKDSILNNLSKEENSRTVEQIDKEINEIKQQIKKYSSK